MKKTIQLGLRIDEELLKKIEKLSEFEGSSLPIVIPVGVDQDPHVRLARDLAHRMKEYELKEITPENMICVVGACPAIYKVKKIK